MPAASAMNMQPTFPLERFKSWIWLRKSFFVSLMLSAIKLKVNLLMACYSNGPISLKVYKFQFSWKVVDYVVKCCLIFFLNDILLYIFLTT